MRRPPPILALLTLFVLAGTILGAPPEKKIAAASVTPVQAGFAAVDLDPPAGVPLAGFGSGPRRTFPFVHGYPYATYFKPSTGTHDTVRAKAMVLKSGDRKLLFLSLDLAAVATDMYEDLVARLGKQGWQREEIVVSATHTHSGPGALSHIWLWELLAADRFKPKVYETVMAHILEAAEQAEQKTQPAVLYSASFQAQGLQRNRRGKEGHFDPTANLLGIGVPSPGFPWRAALLNFAIHGTALNAHNLELSGDVPSALEHSVASTLGVCNPSTKCVCQLNAACPNIPVPVMFMNGAEGDVSPAHGGQEGMVFTAASFSLQLEYSLSENPISLALWKTKPIAGGISVRTLTVPLGRPKITLGACISQKIHDHFSDKIAIPLGTTLPDSAAISIIQIGSIRMITWPGEPTTSVGLALKEISRNAGGAEQTWILGLTNGYQGYFVTPAEFAEGRYEACSDLYGADAANKIINAVREELAKPSGH